MRIVQCVIVLLVVLSHPFLAFSQESQYSFRHITAADGLINNQTNCIFKDSRGFIWFGTSSGLSRYDGSGFRHFSHDSRDSSSLLDNFIVSIQEDRRENLWVQTRWDYSIYNLNTEKFRTVSQVLQEMGITDPVELVYIDQTGNTWLKRFGENHYMLYDPENRQLAYPFGKENTRAGLSDFYHDGDNYYQLFSTGLIECYDGNTFKLKYTDDYLVGKLGKDSLNARIFADRNHELYVYGNNDGIHHYQSPAKTWFHYTPEDGPVRLSSNLIRVIREDTGGKLWIGTDHGGIDVYDKSSQSVTVIKHQPENTKSLSQNSITGILADDEGIVWVSTYKNGINYFHPSIYKFPHFHHIISDPHSLPFNDVNCFAEDRDGNLWIGTNGGGLLYYDRENGSYTTYRYRQDDPHSLSNDVVVSLFIDADNLLWVGTYTGGLNSFDGRRFTRYQTGKEKGMLPNNNIWAISQSLNGDIWIGTLGGGITLFNKETGKFSPPLNNGNVALPSPFVTDIQRMRDGQLFIGTALGVIFYDPEKKEYKLHPRKEADAEIRVSNNNVNAVYEDSRGLLWVATRAGLTCHDPVENRTYIFGVEDGLPEDIINCIQEDNAHAIWVSKSTGVSRIKVIADHEDGAYVFDIFNFTEEDGLQGREFNVNSSARTRKGEIIFGGPEGFNLFQPSEIDYNTILPEIVFTDLQIFNKSIIPGEKLGGRQILDRSLTKTQVIELKHSMNVFSIEFAALNYFIPNKVRYKYKLEGFDREWLETDQNVRKVTYTNLNPGEYTFRVRATNNDGLWSEESASMKVSILPPFYKRPVAYVLYVLVIAGILLYYRYAMLKRERMKFQLEQERLQARRHIELDEMKLRFLTNVSHEFRTPLTLIMTPLEKLLGRTSEEKDSRLLRMIERNANQLLSLVNQLLDFRRLDLDGLQYNPSYGDSVSFIREVCDIFSDSFARKGVKLVFDSRPESCHFLFDHEKVHKVLMNLLSNALKFTPEGGEVSVKLERLHSENGNVVAISVRDNGIGIPENEQEKIFERFYQSPANQALGLSGSGIGLNLVKEMVLLHDGRIEVESREGEGALFRVTLPERHPDILEDAGMEQEDMPQEAEPSENEQTVLLVEDNLDFRSFMKETLQEHYNVLEAGNGRQGNAMIHKYNPDLVISDVMMPNMDGLELCRKMKQDLRTSHIPVILLTARTADEDKIRGLEIGADDYITKPFKMNILLLRIHNLLEKRRKLQEHFNKKMEINPSEVEISTLDEKLIREALAVVEKNIAEPGFSVEDLSHELGMSRAYLYKKLMAITGKSPIEFIRIIRLKRGAQLLEKSQQSISEVAYMVGFNNPRYFSKYFEEEFGMLPSDYVKQGSH